MTATTLAPTVLASLQLDITDRPNTSVPIRFETFPVPAGCRVRKQICLYYRGNDTVEIVATYPNGDRELENGTTTPITGRAEVEVELGHHYVITLLEIGDEFALEATLSQIVKSEIEDAA